MSEIRVVDDQLRGMTQAHGRPRHPEYDELAEGRTVFFPTNGDRPDALANRVRNSMYARGYSATVRFLNVDGEDGMLAWVTGRSKGRKK